VSERGVEAVAAALAGRYRVERELGAGGMATVYLARDLKHDRDVAIKVLKPDLAASLGRDRFLREIQLAAKLGHPHILPLYDSGEAAGALFYVMPNVQGQSLREKLEQQRQLPIAHAVRIATEVAGALDHAHRLGIVHRDIKPENIMLQDGHALVADFGIGKVVSETAGDTLTQAGMSVGTPAYMSPEQAVGEEVDGRSDLYSLGCMLYEMIVGEPPFTGPTVQAVIAKRFVQTPLDVAAMREGVPRAVSRTVQKALARAPVDRYETAAELIASLAEPEPSRGKASTAVPTASLAILPFENLSADADNAYFADGIADDILDALVRVPGLHVAARNSAFSFRGRQASLAEIGDALQVATVLQGSLRRSGNRMRLAVQLVSVADGYHLWSERFDRELVDVFAVQDEIAAAISAKLQVTFVPAAQPAARATTAEVEAFELVAKGRALLARRGTSLIPARECFERAIELVPTNAEAHAGLADTLIHFVRYSLVSIDDGMERARAAANRALALDPQLASAMGTLGFLAQQRDHDLEAACAWWERAIAVQPRSGELRALLAVHGLIFFRRDGVGGMAEIDRAVADDPRSAFCAVYRGVALAAVGRQAEAAADAERACALDPGAFLPMYGRVAILSRGSDPARTLEAARYAMDRIGRHSLVLCWLTKAYMDLGDRRRAEAVYAELDARFVTDEMPRMAMSVAADGIGRTDDAIRYAIESVRRGDFTITCWTSAAYCSDALRAHARYPELLREIGL
jgi:serine/threonine-protein kinase